MLTPCSVPSGHRAATVGGRKQAELKWRDSGVSCRPGSNGSNERATLKCREHRTQRRRPLHSEPGSKWVIRFAFVNRCCLFQSLSRSSLENKRWQPLCPFSYCTVQTSTWLSNFMLITTLQVFCLCRLFGYRFLSKTSFLFTHQCLFNSCWRWICSSLKTVNSISTSFTLSFKHPDSGSPICLFSLLFDILYLLLREGIPSGGGTGSASWIATGAVRKNTIISQINSQKLN